LRRGRGTNEGWGGDTDRLRNKKVEESMAHGFHSDCILDQGDHRRSVILGRQLSKVAFSVLFAIGSALPHSAGAFKTDDTGHGGINRDALGAVSITINGETLKFTDRAITEVRQANFDVDWHQLAATYHFDDESLPGGSQRIVDLRKQVIDSAVGGDGKAARQALGGAMHTIQDFFAHSNQVDFSLTIPNFGTDLLTALPSTTKTCESDGATLIKGAGLTTGYFKFVFGLCAPSGKCNHGDHGFCTAGINKDESTNPLHSKAYDNAKAASIAFVKDIINDSRMTADPRAIKRLMDIRPMVSTAIDDTGSMGPVIGSVNTAVASIVNSLVGTPDEPDKYLLVRFGDPSVGSASIFQDATSFLSAVAGIFPSGGGDCPELSMDGAYNAVAAADNDARLFVFTDASAKDAGVMGAVANLASQKRISVSTALSGSCSPYDPTYFELARRTGGQVFVTTHNETGATIAKLMMPFVRNDIHLGAQASVTLTGNTFVLPVPVDDTVSEATFSIGTDNKGTINIRRPDGSVVQPTDAGVVVTDSLGARMVTVASPNAGTWQVAVTGTGTALVTAAFVTTAYLHTFQYVNLAGRPEHQGLFPIDGRPIGGKTQTVQAILFGIGAPLQFSFRRPDGSLIAPFAMTSNDPRAGTKEDFVGDVVPPSEPFLVYVTGTTAAGQPFQRVLPGQQATSSVEVMMSSDLTSIPAGRGTDVVFSITNYGAAGSFALSAKDSRGFIVASPASPITLTSGQSTTAAVRLSPPASTPVNTQVAITLTAAGPTPDATNSASRVLTIGDANSPPVCTAASASPSVIRSVNHTMVPVSILGVTDADNDPVTITISSIIQNEPVTGAGSGNTGVDAVGVGQSSAQVRAERSGQGVGRLYRINFDAADGKGGTCSASVTVQVPHDNRTSSPEGKRYYLSTSPR
jgi:hypothetical protein